MDGADPERLAALLDERLSGAERDELLARLADSDEDLALFAEAAAVQRELEEEDEAASVPGVLPLRPPARPARRLDRRWLAAAAVVAGLALVPMAWRATQGGAVREPAQAVAMLGDQAIGLPRGWIDRPAWSGTRGGGENPADDALSVRVGAYMVNLEVAIRAGDVENTRLLSARVASMLREANVAGTPAARQFDVLAERAGGDPAELLSLLDEASDAAAGALDGDRYALGAWAEAARIAAARRDAAFFRDARTGRTLDRAQELVGDDEEARAAIAAIRASLEAESILWPELEAELDRLMSAVGS
jgi:hypothetical protein